MKHLFLFFAALLMFGGTYAQTTIFSDDFETPAVGDYVSNSEGWQTWNNTHGGANDALISDEQNHTAGGAKSMKIIADNDMVYMTGGQTSGHYQAKFWYYVPTGQGAYFNVQHAFGANWAMSIEMNSGGNGTLDHSNGNPPSTVAFTFPHDQWFEIIIDMDISNDQSTLTINGTEVDTWAFSASQSAGGAMAKLDCINFYGYPDVNPPYYVDDFEFIEVEAASETAELELSATSFSGNGTSDQVLTLSNTGLEALTYEALVSYKNPTKAKNTSNINTDNTTSNSKEVSLMTPSAKKLAKPIKVNTDSKDVTLTHVTGNLSGSLGFNGSQPVDIKAAALFKYTGNANATADLKNYIGMEISSVIVAIGNMPQGNSGVLEIYEGRDGIVLGPKDTPIRTQNFTVSQENEQINVNLDEPVFVSGKDMFVGYAITQPVGAYCLAMDEGPVIDDANWLKSGVVWTEFTNPPGQTFGNFGIIANLTGEAMHQWLTLDNTNGSIDPSSDADITLQFNITGMEQGTYNADLIVKTNDNDEDESYNVIPVTLDVITSVDNISNTAVMTYPNPAYDYLNVAAFSEIKHVTIYNIAGKAVSEMDASAKEVKLPIADLSAGVYFVNITTKDQTITKKFIVK